MDKKMTYNSELKKIKKEYGEKFMHLCRELFPTILETEGLLTQILSSMFAENCRRSLYDDIMNADLEGSFKDHVYTKFHLEDLNTDVVDSRTPYEILDEAGYDLFECTTEEEIQGFRKYYKSGEELCTFNGDRLEKCVVFFAVRKDVKKIKREDFPNPERENEYGTSVMGIQFTKQGQCIVSIKNRYNHTVSNPDATYGNDLNRIAPGLTRSFERLLAERGLLLDSNNVEAFEILNYMVANDGRYYKYNMEIDGVYYCPGNIVINYGEIERIENPESQLLADYFLINIKEKTITLYDEKLKDSFLSDFQDIEKIEVQKNIEKSNGVRNILIYKKDKDKPVIIEIDRNNQIIGYENEYISQVEDEFLANNKALSRLLLPNLEQTQDSFLFANNQLSELNLPKLRSTGNCFLYSNNKLNKVNLPELEEMGEMFLYRNNSLRKLELPKLKHIADNCLSQNNSLLELNLPNLVRIDSCFLFKNNSLKNLTFENVESIGYGFMHENINLESCSFPNLKIISNSFLYMNIDLKEINVPRLEKIGDCFLAYNNCLRKLNLPETTEIGRDFLFMNEIITQVNAPKLIKLDSNYYRFLCNRPKVAEKILKEVEERKKIIQIGDIALLDKNTSLTSSELSMAKDDIEKNTQKEVESEK